jgi:hypothetical protein
MISRVSVLLPTMPNQRQSPARAVSAARRTDSRLR